MAETDDNPTDSHHTVHDVFRFLVDVRGLAPFVAKKEILEKLQLDRLHVDLHIRGGARKMQPSRQATIDELRAQAAGGTLDHLYETTPPEGATFPVHPDSWGAGKIFDLMIRDGKLIVIQQHSLDFPWDAYSFTVADWSNALALWPAPVPAALPPIRIELASAPSTATPAFDANTPAPFAPLPPLAGPVTAAPATPKPVTAEPVTEPESRGELEPAPSTPVSKPVPATTSDTQPQKDTIKTWVPKALDLFPRREGQTDASYSRYLETVAPNERMKARSIANELSNLAKSLIK